jgi:hypothetical protein
MLTLRRTWGDPPFSERSRRLFHFFHCELGKLIGTELATATDTGLCGLPLRQRQTLELLVVGKTKQEIADRLGITATTVRDYVDRLHVHFSVCSTPSLIAVYLGRNRVRPSPSESASRSSSRMELQSQQLG